ncbi:TPA: protein YkgH, partial [Escherichia coli]
LYPNGDGCVTISSPEIKNKYPAAIYLALGFFISIVISVMFCLVKKMVDEYQQNSGQ